MVGTALLRSTAKSTCLVVAHQEETAAAAALSSSSRIARCAPWNISNGAAGYAAPMASRAESRTGMGKMALTRRFVCRLERACSVSLLPVATALTTSSLT